MVSLSFDVVVSGGKSGSSWYSCGGNGRVLFVVPKWFMGALADMSREWSFDGDGIN